LKSNDRVKEAYTLLKNWIDQEDRINNDALNIEYIKLLIEIGDDALALEQTKHYLSEVNKSLTKHYCSHCGFNSDEIFWRCQQCHKWETIQFRWKV
jgi:lipopolysaccharide biosynthesis regulator YciM